MNLDELGQSMFILTNEDGQVYTAEYDDDGVGYEVTDMDGVTEAIHRIRAEYLESGGSPDGPPIRIYRLADSWLDYDWLQKYDNPWGL